MPLRATLHGAHRPQQRAGHGPPSRAPRGTAGSRCPLLAPPPRGWHHPERSRCLAGGTTVTTAADTGAAPVPSPSPDASGAVPARTALVEIKGLVKAFPVRAGVLQRTVAEVRAVDGVDLVIQRGETLGLVGESG